MTLFDLLARVLDLYSIIIVVRVLSDWIPNSRNYQIVQFLILITEPFLSRIRGILPQMGNLDFSPIAAIFALEIVGTILKNL
ncbi:MAG: YggT family protein [Dehalococcoidia bacterium]|nr:YggT family protein [Dehalococcoidia bacterium]